MSTEVFGADLHEPFGSVLRTLHCSEPQVGADGVHYEIDATTRISPEEGSVLYDLCVQVGARATVEVGLGYGFSTAYLLAALDSNGGGFHTAIDPFQQTDWRGIGQTTARSLVANSRKLKPASFTLVEAPSHWALPALHQSGARFDVTFIDGYHRFDDVLVDFTLAAPMCPLGGTIVLHDMWLDSIASVAAFLNTNRTDFVEVATGCENLFAVRRVGDDQRNWDHFVPFVARGSG